ncbi:MAG: PaaI family thioesterase, partial [Candidatus Neomarinimicrobiota bacterium]
EYSEAPFELPEVYFTKYLGFRTESPQPGRSTIALDLQPYHLNIAGVVHGGFLMTVLDTLMGHAVFTYLRDAGARFATSSMTTHFLRAVSKGRLTGTGRVVSGGKKYIIAEAELWDEQDQLIATAEAQYTSIGPPGR